MLDVPGDANTNLRHENNQQKNRERQNHPAGFFQRPATAEERDDENHRADNHKNDGGCPKCFANKILIMMVGVLNYGADDNGE